jgi:predicted helicase
LKEPVRNASQGGQLNTFPELSVAFWRWAIWKLFEAENAPRRGVVAFITNRKFLTGWPYAGLRKMLRERFDRIEIIDLRGDVRRGERAGVSEDQGVFNIMVGTAITIAIADGTKAMGEAADVLYTDSWGEGLFSRRAKLDWLARRADTGTVPNPVAVQRAPLDDMRPRPFQNGEWVSIADCFLFRRGGIQTKRDHFVYSPSYNQLVLRLTQFRSLGDAAAADIFAGNPTRPWNVARSQPLSTELIRLVSYRPLDRRWLYNNEAFIDRPRPELQEAWGTSNMCLYALPGGTGAGPAVWCHGLVPDYHSFRGSFGGYAFPLYDRRHGAETYNVSTALVQNLSAAYGEQITVQEIFDAILCLLSATTYSALFAEDLEDVFPHIPFPAGLEVFRSAARLGSEIRGLQAFSRVPSEAYTRSDFVRVVSQPMGNLAAAEYSDGAIALCRDGSGRITGLPKSVWDFAVSGYRLLPRWLESRIGLPADFSLVSELRDICGRIAELIDLFASADIVLEGALRQTLSREVLGFELSENASDATN